MNLLNLDNDKNEQLNKMLDKKIKPKMIVTKSQADVIRAKTEELKKAASKE